MQTANRGSKLPATAELDHNDAMNWLIDKARAALKQAGYQKITLRGGGRERGRGGM